MHLQGEGALTIGKNEERLNSRAAEIDQAIIAESARWGDGRGWGLHTRNDHWVPQVEKIRNEFFPYRTDILTDQLLNADLYSEMDAPSVFLDGQIRQETDIQVNGPSSLKLVNPNQAGGIYYTTDGSDPRTPGNLSSMSAQNGGSREVTIQFQGSAVVKARINYLDEWSALKEVRLRNTNEDFSGLVISELNYHPTSLVVKGDTTPGRDLEFIELKNTSANAIQLGGLVLDSAVYYAFPENEILPPGGFYVVASKPSSFYLRNGMVASGNYDRHLSNGGEEFLLEDASGNPLIHFTYSDELPWPLEADGQGYTLVPTEANPTGNPADYTYWKASAYVGGSPFSDDFYNVAANDPLQADPEIRLYPNPTAGVLNILWPEGYQPDTFTASLYSLNGQELFEMEGYYGQQINLEGLGLPPGVFFVTLRSEDHFSRHKIILQ
jgi:hypothetical protein